MARLLEKALRRSEAVDREALCIVAGQKVRSIIYPTLGRTNARW
jgi:exosome complex component RRP45